MASAELGKFSGFKEFWPYYLNEHDNPKTRACHALGTSIGLAATAAVAVLVTPLLIPVGIAAIYGALTVSHVAFQGNKPATFQHFTVKNALMAVRADLTMIGKWFTGSISKEYKRLGLDPTGKKHAGKIQAAKPAPAPVNENKPLASGNQPKEVFKIAAWNKDAEPPAPSKYIRPIPPKPLR